MKKLLIPSILCFIILVYFILSLKIINSGYFIWDDKSFLFSSLVTNGSWADILLKPNYGLYQPFTTLYVKVNYIFHGNSASVLHVENLILHILNSLIVYRILRQLGFRGHIGFGIFLFHPLSCEVAYWITSVKDLWFVFFGLLSIHTYLKYISRPTAHKWLVITYILVCLSMLSKVQAIVLPFILIIIDQVKRDKTSIKTVSEKIPLIIIGFGLIAVNIWFRDLDSDMTALNSSGFIERILNANVILCKYLFTLLLPVEQSVFYPRQSYDFLIISASLSFLTLLIFFLVKRHRNLAWLFIAVVFCLLPVLQILPIGESEMNDRYAYLSSGILAVALEIVYLKLKPKLASAIVAIYFVFIAISFVGQSSLWSNQNSLFESSYKKYPDSEIIANTLGVLYLHDNDFNEAEKFFDKALKAEPGYAQAYYNKGLMFEKMSDSKTSVSYHKKALDLNPRYVDALDRISKIYYELNQLDSAQLYVNRILRLTNQNASAYDLAGKLEYAKANTSKSIDYYRQAVSIEGNNPVYLYNLAVSLGYTGDYEASINILNNCIKLDPSFHQAYYLRGIAKIRAGLDGCKDLHTAKEKGNTDVQAAIEKFCNQ